MRKIMSKITIEFDKEFIRKVVMTKGGRSFLDNLESFTRDQYVCDTRFGENRLTVEDIKDDFNNNGNFNISNLMCDRRYFVDPNLLGGNVISKQRLHEIVQEKKAMSIFGGYISRPSFMKFAYECSPPIPIEDLINLSLM